MMSSNETNELNQNENSFFNNSSVPKCLKAGAVAVLTHATVNYYKDNFNHDVFSAMHFDRDKRPIGTIMFTFGNSESMGDDNFMASMKRVEEIYPIGNILDSLSAKSSDKTDEEILEALAKASTLRFNLSAEGSALNWDRYVSDSFDKFSEYVKLHYAGTIKPTVLDNIKMTFEGFSKKKQTIARQMAD